MLIYLTDTELRGLQRCYGSIVKRRERNFAEVIILAKYVVAVDKSTITVTACVSVTRVVILEASGLKPSNYIVPMREKAMCLIKTCRCF
jgi:hypothetical protein